ncbi:pseudouridine synthase [uncultured Treponema sp.]|uniref:pseudouridine synthase n=1 Tax=uncultured Treponema sp. TaxID=162155 RepID=UPI002593A008|nr:pseudouridine synthase [uncultured Treponema sp.]
MSTERIDKLLSHEGFGTRREIKRLVRYSEVCVNGTRIFDSGFPVNPDKDILTVDGEKVILRKNVYLMMNKKPGVVSANKDGLHQTVFDFLPEEYRSGYLAENLHIVGRLDIDTEGLLLFTTDGTLTHKIISPKTHFPKTYFVRLSKPESAARQAEIARLFADGIHVSAEGKEAEFDAKSAHLVWKNESEAELTITEGKYHQVKRMFAEAGNEVSYLKRLSIGSLKLDESLAPGEFRELSQVETDALFL